MVMRWPWLLALLSVGFVAVVLLGWRRPRGRLNVADALPAANLRRLAALPAYRRARRLWLVGPAIEGAALLALAAGTTIAAARPVESLPEELKRRDIVLCLDVSGSMSTVDAAITDSYAELVSRLDSERIGLVVWDSSAAMAFPLTDDHDYIREQLRRARRDFLSQESESIWAGTREGNAGSSLIGDGLMSCLQRFDAPVERRPRTIVLGTDNALAGQAVYSLPEAIDAAKDQGVLVYGVAPSGARAADLAALGIETRRTGGDVLLLDQAGGGDVSQIVDLVERQEAQFLARRSPDRWRDIIWPGVTLATTGMVAGALVWWRRSR